MSGARTRVTPRRLGPPGGLPARASLCSRPRLSPSAPTTRSRAPREAPRLRRGSRRVGPAPGLRTPMPGTPRVAGDSNRRARGPRTGPEAGAAGTRWLTGSVRRHLTARSDADLTAAQGRVPTLSSPRGEGAGPCDSSVGSPTPAHQAPPEKRGAGLERSGGRGREGVRGCRGEERPPGRPCVAAPTSRAGSWGCLGTAASGGVGGRRRATPV